MGICVLLANIAGIIGWLLLVYSYYKEDIDKLLFVQIISSIFYCINYILLGAYSGFLICLFELIKEFLYYKTDKDKYIFLFTLPIYFFIAYTTSEYIYDLLPIMGSIIYGFTLTKNKNIATAGGIVSNILWVIYDVIIMAYSCAITDVILVLSNICILVVGYSRLLKVGKINITKCNYLSRNTCSTMYELDKDNYGEEYIWDYKYQKEIFDKNNDSLLLIKYKNKIIGYLNYLVISETLYNHIIESSEMLLKYNEKSIIKFKQKQKNYLLIESVNIEKKYQNEAVMKLIRVKFKKLIQGKYLQNCKIESILSVAVSDFENTILNKLNFNELKKYEKNQTLYMLNKDQIKEHYLNENIK